MIKSIKENIFILKYLFHCSRLFVSINIVTSVIGAFPAIIIKVWLTRYVLDAVEFGNGVRAFYIIACTLILLVIYEVISNLLGKIILPIMKTKILQKMHFDVFQKVICSDIDNFDNPAMYSDLLWAKRAVDSVAFDCLSNICAFINNLMQVFLVMMTFVNINPIYISFALVSFIIVMFVNKLIAKENVNEMEETMEVDRKIGYFNKLFALPDYAKEMRLYNIGRLAECKLKSAYEAKQKITKNRSKKICKLDCFQAIFGGLIISDFLVKIVLGCAIIQYGLHSIGDFSAVSNGVSTLLSSLFVLVGPLVSSFSKNSVIIEKFRKFTESRPSLQDGCIEEINLKEPSIECKNILFSYVKGNEPVISSVSFKIDYGKKVAIVGENGSGKSTLVKLLLRLYDVDSGSICLNETCIKNYYLKEYRNCYSKVFQNFQLYALNLGENIAMDSIFDKEQIDYALKKANFSIEERNGTEKTNIQITKLFSDDGVILSGGECQRIALARVFYENKPIVLFDEPTSALDPLGEYMFNKMLFEEENGKTIIVISHRLSTTKDCWKSKGTIMRCGMHRQINLQIALSVVKMRKIRRFYCCFT